MGIRGAIQDKGPAFSSAFLQYLERAQASDSDEDNEEESTVLSIEELLEEDLVRRKHTQPGALNLRVAELHQETSLAVVTNLIHSIINECFGKKSDEKHFDEIANYTANSIIQESLNLTELVDDDYRETLELQIIALFNDKFIDMKHEAFFDLCTAFYLYPLSLPESAKNTENPDLFVQYADIFALQHDEYRYYDRAFYQMDYFDILKSAHKTIEEREVDEYLMNAFMMNIDKYMVYYGRRLKQEREDAEEEEDEDEEEYEDEECAGSESFIEILGDEEDSFIFADDERNFALDSAWQDEEEESDVEEEPEVYQKKEVKIRFNESVSSIGIYPGEPAFYVYCDRNSIPIA